MILPGILLVIGSTWPQEPASAQWSVAAAHPDIPAAAVAAIEAEMPPALARVLEVLPAPRQPFRLIVHRDEADLPAALQQLHHAGSPGFALLARHEIHLLFAAIGTRGLRAVLVHELTHELLHQAVEPHGHRLPRWFHEGLAQVVARDSYLGLSEEAILWRASSDQLLPFSELAVAFPGDPWLLRLAYAQSHSYVGWLERRVGLASLVDIARAVTAERSFDVALVRATSRSTAELLESWRQYVINDSGAQWRVLLQRSFALTIVFAVPLLAMAMIRRQRVDRRAREQLMQAEAPIVAAEAAPPNAAADAATATAAEPAASGNADGENMSAPPPTDGKTPA